MKRTTLSYLALSLCAACAYVTPITAQETRTANVICDDMTKMKTYISEKYGETLVAIAEHAQGFGFVEIWAGHSTSSVLHVYPDKNFACILVGGGELTTLFENIPEQIQGDEL